ncbi:hypothetical protein HDU99_006209 [Rhizoclosmatium hyalinum]|nr:hypothetical protein HDU99_006209 [Rhizoclosmatium hyalinum]
MSNTLRLVYLHINPEEEPESEEEPDSPEVQVYSEKSDIEEVMKVLDNVLENDDDDILVIGSVEDSQPEKESVTAATLAKAAKSTTKPRILPPVIPSRSQTSPVPAIASRFTLPVNSFMRRPSTEETKLPEPISSGKSRPTGLMSFAKPGPKSQATVSPMPTPTSKRDSASSSARNSIADLDVPHLFDMDDPNSVESEVAVVNEMKRKSAENKKRQSSRLSVVSTSLDDISSLTQGGGVTRQRSRKSATAKHSRLEFDGLEGDFFKDDDPDPMPTTLPTNLPPFQLPVRRTSKPDERLSLNESAPVDTTAPFPLPVRRTSKPDATLSLNSLNDGTDGEDSFDSSFMFMMRRKSKPEGKLSLNSGNDGDSESLAESTTASVSSSRSKNRQVVVVEGDAILPSRFGSIIRPFSLGTSSTGNSPPSTPPAPPPRKYAPIVSVTSMLMEIPKRSSNYTNWTKEQLIARLQSIDNERTISAVPPKTEKKGKAAKTQRPFDFSKHSARPVAFKVAYLGWKYHGLASQDGGSNVATIESELFKALHTARLIPEPSGKGCGWSRCGRFDCTYRRYRYFFPSEGLDLAKMQEAAKKYIGAKDYRHFCKVDPSKNVKTYVRTVLDASVEPLVVSDDLIPTYTNFGPHANQKGPVHPESFLVFEVKGHAFLWHQVRCMTAILHLIGRGLEQVSLVDDMTDLSKHPENSGRPIYGMASEIPLVLVECGFKEGLLDWRVDGDVAVSRNGLNGLSTAFRSSDAFAQLITCLWDQWREHSIKATQVQALLQMITKDSFNHTEDVNLRNVFEEYAKEGVLGNASMESGGYGGKSNKAYIPIMQRKRCDSIEERTVKYNASKKGKK